MHPGKLLQYIEQLPNSKACRKVNRTDAIGVAPLPAPAQFLNVIESVFSGRFKSVIRHSDYESVEDCKKATDAYFYGRNNCFALNPGGQAGKKIWAKERVNPVFDKANFCKMPNTGRI
jgi:hypothetical protein